MRIRSIFLLVCCLFLAAEIEAVDYSDAESIVYEQLQDFYYMDEATKSIQLSNYNLISILNKICPELCVKDQTFAELGLCSCEANNRGKIHQAVT